METIKIACPSCGGRGRDYKTTIEDGINCATYRSKDQGHCKECAGQGWIQVIRFKDYCKERFGWPKE